MKHVLFLLVLEITTCSAQMVYRQDFQGGNRPADITRYDLDKGSGYVPFADTSWYVHGRHDDPANLSAWSTGCTASGNPTAADNWMILPKRIIPPNAFLTYRAARTSEQGSTEHLYVMVSTKGAGTTDFNEIIDTCTVKDDQWQQRTTGCL